MRHRITLATAEEHQRSRTEWYERINTAPRQWKGGGRCGTIRTTLELFANIVGNPHEAAPAAEWRDYDKPLVDGAGKISAIWCFTTPRGPVMVSDYWWNKPDELSVRAADVRAMIWFRLWCKRMRLAFHTGTE